MVSVKFHNCKGSRSFSKQGDGNRCRKLEGSKVGTETKGSKDKRQRNQRQKSKKATVQS